MNTQIKIWVVDDERGIRVSLADDLRDAGYDVREFANAHAVLNAMADSVPSIVITDIKMPGIDGIELLIKLKELNPDVFVIIMTAYGTIESAVEAMKLGAYNYITKPFNTEEIFLIINRILELNTYKKENKLLREKIDSEFDFSSYIGDKTTNRALFDLIKLVSQKDTTVLITGETGTGKELLTNIIHYNSIRKGQRLVKVSCAILAKEIFESELFGHEKGAFTGAEKEKIGRFELANGGTLYLDDIDDMPIDLQVKLLRVLEESEIERVGSGITRKIDVRIIASTKANLKVMVDEGKFREDLYYRLNVFPIRIPPLRERPDDIKYLVDYFYKKFTGVEQSNFDDESYKILKKYPFPGNVRELRNLVERMCLYAHEGKITPDLIPNEIINQNIVPDFSRLGQTSLTVLLDEFEKSALETSMQQARNNKTKAAILLGLPLSTLRTKLQKYNMD